MSEEATELEEAVQAEAPTIDRLATLKQRADMVGFKYHHKVGVKKLAADLEAYLAQDVADQAEAVETSVAKPAVGKGKMVAPQSERKMRFEEAARLVRVRVTNMNPNKKDWEGEIFTASNSIGTWKKYVPFNAENGWHVPVIILNMMKEKKFQAFTTIKGPNGQKRKEGKLIRELAIEMMDPLTSSELKELAREQAIAANREV